MATRGIAAQTEAFVLLGAPPRTNRLAGLLHANGMAGRQEGEKEAPAGFADLPQEILLMVCSKLPSGDLLFNFPSVRP